METILRIEEFEEDNYEGFKIITDKQEIMLMIDNYQNCCESWGYFMTEDNLDKFIGSNIIEIKLTNEMNKCVNLVGKVDDWLFNDKGELTLYEGGAMFVDIVTNVGVLQFVAYNEHNGYYGHEACVISSQLNYSDIL